MKRHLSDYITAFIVLLCSAILLAALTIALSGYRANRIQRSVEIDFPDVTGIRLHSEVRYAGAPAGRVIAMRHLSREERTAAVGEQRQNAVRVTVEIKDDVPELPEDTKATLASETLLSEKFVALSAGSPEAARLASGVVLQGENNGNLNDLFAAVGPMLKSVDQTLAALRPLVSKTDETIDAIKTGVDNALTRISAVADSAKGVAATADALLKRTDQLIAENETGIHENLEALRKALLGLQQTVGSADKFVGRTDRDLAARMQELSVVLQNLKVASTHAKAVTQTLGEQPSRLIWGSKRNTLTPEEQILRNSKPVPATTPTNRR